MSDETGAQDGVEQTGPFSRGNGALSELSGCAMFGCIGALAGCVLAPVLLLAVASIAARKSVGQVDIGMPVDGGTVIVLLCMAGAAGGASVAVVVWALRKWIRSAERRYS